MKAEEVLKKFNDKKKNEPGLGRFVTSKIAQVYWRKMCVYYYDYEFVCGFTALQLGQFSHLVKKTNETGNRTRDVLIAVLQRWQEFCWAVQGQTGVKGPEKPNIGFLLKYVEIALSWSTINTQKINKPASEAPAAVKEPSQNILLLHKNQGPIISALEIISQIRAKK